MIAIDLGSNTLRVVQLACETGQILASFERVVKTADGLVESGRVSGEATQRVIAAIKQAQKEIDFSSDRLRAVTTEALRRASNAEEVLEEIKQETGVAFEIIGGEEEADLTLLAVRNRLSLLDPKKSPYPWCRSFFLIDIGGGSTELIFCHPHQTMMKSFPVGIVTVVQSHATLEAIEAAIPELMAEMACFAKEVFQKEGSLDLFVATAGTPTTVAAMKLGQTYATYDSQQINGTTLEISDLEYALHHLLDMPFGERERHVGVGRSDLIAVGILIFKQLFLIAQKPQCIVVDDGLREGVALESCNKSIVQGKKRDFLIPLSL